MTITFKWSLIKIKCKKLNSKDSKYKLFSCEYRLSSKMSLTKNAADFIFVSRAANRKPNKLTEISLMWNNYQTKKKCKKNKKAKFIGAFKILTLLTNKTSFSFTVSVYPFTVNSVEIYTVSGWPVIVISVPVCIINWRLIRPQISSFIHTVC